MAPKRSRKRKAEVPEPDPWNDSWNGEEEDPWAHETHQNQSEDPWRFVAEDDVPADGDSMLVENPWASNPGSKLTTHNSQIHLDAALRLASDLAPIAKEASQYDTNGACPKRLGCVLSSNCKRKHCARPGCKAGVISHQEVCSFMEKWVKLPLPDRSHLLRCNYYQDNSVIATDAEAVKETVEWHMCGYAICFQRFCEILGSSQRTVRRLISGQPDLRLSKSGFGSQSRAAVQTAKCDHFFRTLHASAAEPMPEEAQMYPKAKQLGSHSGVQVSRSSGVQKRDMTSIDAWEHWSYDWLSMPPADVQAAEKAHCGTLGLPIRYIQHQRLIDLYWQFTAEWDIHVERNPGDGECPAFQTFAKRYYSHWRYVLVMRKISQHGQCKTCFDFHSVLRSPKADWSTKDHWCEVVCRVLDMVWKIAERDGRRVPPHLVLVADNTPAQCHNQLAMRPLIYLTAKEYFTSITMFHLMAILIGLRKWQTPDAMLDHIKAKLEPRDIWNCFKPRAGIPTPHCFMCMKGKNLPRKYAVMLEEPKEDEAVYCCVKGFVRDTCLLQPPVYLSPPGRHTAIRESQPGQLIGKKEMSESEIQSYIKLAQLCKTKFDMPEAADEKLNQWYGKIFAQLQADMSDSSLASVHEWMERTFPNTTAKNQLMTDFSNLESECRKILAAPDNGTITSDVPEVLVHNDVPVRFKIRLHNFGFLEDSQLKGPVQSYAVSLGLHACLAKHGHVNIHVASLFSKIPGLVQLRRDNIQKFMTNQKGNQTNKYPLEILFDYVCKLNQHPVKPGSVIPAFSIAMFIGSSTIMSSFLLCIYACKLKIIDAVKGDLKLEREVATRLLSCLVIHCTAVTATNHDQAMLNAFAQKREALTRVQPSLFQHYSVYQRILAKRPPARGTRDAHLRSIMVEQNKLSVTKAKIHSNEMTAILLLDSAGPGFQKIIAKAHMADQPQDTAFPLSLLNKDFLQPTFPNPVRLGFTRMHWKKEDNPLWHAIHEHSWDKVTTWAQRVSGKWDHRMQQALKAGQALSYKNGAVAADMRDSGKELNVWYMAQAMCYFDDHFQKALKPDRFDQVKSDWLAGKLDTQILPAVLAKRKDFQPRDFQFVLLEQQDALSGLNFLSLGSSEKQESLQRLHKQLGQEQKAWRAHMAKVKAHEDSSMGSFNRQVSRQQEALEEAWQEQSTKFIQVFSCADVAGAILLVNQAKAMIADEQLKDASGIPCIFEWNFPKAGARASKLIPAVASTIAVSCSENPKTVIHVVIPPCQPVYGKGDSAGDERIASIEDHVNNLWQQLNDPSHRLSVRKVNALWNSETFYSSDRELGFEVWLVLAESTRDVSKSTRSYNNVFGNSSLLKRGAFPFLLNAMERKDFQNWKAPLGFDQGKGSILQKDDFLLVADMLMYDSEPGKGNVIAENVKEDLASVVKVKIRSKNYRMPSTVAIPEVVKSDAADPAPKYNPDDFKLTYPRSNLQLPLLQKVVTEGESLQVSMPDPENPAELLTFPKLVKIHNDEFNPSGQPWNPDQGQGEKRKAEGEPECGPKVVVEAVSPPDGLIPTGVQGADGAFQLFLDPKEASLYLHCAKDSAVGPDEKPWFYCKGSFRAGSQADAEMKKAGAQFIDSAMTKSTKVLVQQIGSALEIPQQPTPLGAVLEAFSSLRQPVGQIFKHKCTDSEVKATESICFVLEINTKPVAPNKPIEPNVLSTYVELSKHSHIEAVQNLKYEAEHQTLKQGIPAVFPAHSFNIEKDKYYKL
ncbi:Uncharacterized protein SCF082_LOCUS30386 [Durusdinium trenchii]|uniref:Uncharacterized protein n=1 Tax=Durusdinium trenchii TaxID=1381693 RepID=A0ABP0MY01_9DINO